MNQDFWIDYKIKENELINNKKKFVDMNRREAKKRTKLIISEIAFVIIAVITLLFS